MPLEARNIYFAYEKQHFLQNVSILLQKGDFTMLLGPNGSGKSTVVKLLGGYLKPQKGVVEFDNVPLADMRHFERARKIAVVSQTPPSVFDFNVQEMIMTGRLCRTGRLTPPSAVDIEIVSNIMDMLEISRFAGRKIQQLSGGERQRVMLAQALAQEPDYLLLDEPTSALDPEHRFNLMYILNDLRKRMGILMVCHDLNLAWNYAEKIVVLQNGRIVLNGDSHAVLTSENIRKVFNCDAVIYPDNGIILK